MNPKKNAFLPVRLTDEEKSSLSKIADDTGLSSSTLVRLAISSLISYYNRNGHRMTLPLKWDELTGK